VRDGLTGTRRTIHVKRFLVAIPTAEGGVELFAMKEWLRQHPDAVPSGLDATRSNSHALRAGLKRAGWIVQEQDTEIRLIRPDDAGRERAIAAVLDAADAGETEDDDGTAAGSEQAFGLEHQLRDFLAQNLQTLALDGRRLQLYVDPAGRDGVEYPTAVGPIDLLAVDERGHLVVFELKRARSADRAVGQLARYMGWVKHTIGRGTEVRGAIVAKAIDDRLRYAALVIPGVTLFEYAVEFHLRPAVELPREAARRP
jgi:hypothetical protein